MATTTVNIRGTRFELSSRTFNKLLLMSESTCLCEAVVTGNSQKEYFFERHPESFAAILDFLYHGELHLPSHVCPNIFLREINFWGLDISKMENCCYHNFVTFVEDRKTLRKFEKQTFSSAADIKPPKSRVQRFRASAWSLLDDPSSSVAAKIFMVASIVFVFVSMFVTIAGTHPMFQRQLKKQEWKQFLGNDLSKYYRYLQEVHEDILFDEFETDDENSTADEMDYDPQFPPTTTLNPNRKSKIAMAHARVDVLRYLEYATLAFFTVEFLLRVIVCPSLKLYVFNIINIVDFAALGALYISVSIELFSPAERYSSSTADLIQLIQFMRVFRFLRLVKNVTGFRVLVYSFTSSAKELLLLLSFLALGVVVFGSIAYYAEDVQIMKSIPDASWWALITMTTVGYGDMYPHTAVGKLTAAACAISGVLMIAVTVPIFVNTFILFYSYSKVMDVRLKESRAKRKSADSPIWQTPNKVLPMAVKPT